jgi:hypothetical protein
MALGILAGTISTLFLALVAEAGQLVVWLGGFAVPLIVQEVRLIGRDWSRSKALWAAAIVAMAEGIRSGKLGWLLSKALRGFQHWATGHAAPAALASGLTIGGFTVVTAAFELSNPFFPDEVRMEVLGFSLDDAAKEEDLVEPGGTIRACDVSTFYASIRAEGLDQGAGWVQRWEVDDEVFTVDRNRWRGEERSTQKWGPAYLREGTDEPTGEPLPNGVWVLTIRSADDTLDEASIKLINDAC